MRRTYKRSNSKGFTLLEMVLVVAIIVILASSLIFAVSRYINAANKANQDVIDATNMIFIKNKYFKGFSVLGHLPDSMPESPNYSADADGLKYAYEKVVNSQADNNLNGNELTFKYKGNEVAYISNKTLYINDAEIKEQETIGNFAHIPRDNGSLSFRKVR